MERPIASTRDTDCLADASAPEEATSTVVANYTAGAVDWLWRWTLPRTVRSAG